MNKKTIFAGMILAFVFFAGIYGIIQTMPGLNTGQTADDTIIAVYDDTGTLLNSEGQFSFKTATWGEYTIMKNDFNYQQTDFEIFKVGDRMKMVVNDIDAKYALIAKDGMEESTFNFYSSNPLQGISYSIYINDKFFANETTSECRWTFYFIPIPPVQTWLKAYDDWLQTHTYETHMVTFNSTHITETWGNINYVVTIKQYQISTGICVSTYHRQILPNYALADGSYTVKQFYAVLTSIGIK